MEARVNFSRTVAVALAILCFASAAVLVSSSTPFAATHVVLAEDCTATW